METDDQAHPQNPLEQANSLPIDEARLKQLVQTLDTTPVDPAHEIGEKDPISRSDVDLQLHPSREIPVAGELWSVFGEIHNRSSSPIWIVDTKTVLTIPPEIWGQASQGGSIGGFFPTVKPRPTDEVIRIDPGAKYDVVWKIQTIAQVGFRNRIVGILRNFAFFNPGTFRISSTAHIWNMLPKFNDQGRAVNTGDSFTLSVSRNIQMEASPWVLILGAATGGVLCFILQVLFGIIPFTSFFEAIKPIIVGLGSAVLLTGVMTVLISRLATTEFLVVVKVKDIWGSIATGFVIQWFGYTLLAKYLFQVSGS